MTGSFLFSICGQGVAMYTLDPTTVVAAEGASSATIPPGQTAKFSKSLLQQDSTALYRSVVQAPVRSYVHRPSQLVSNGNAVSVTVSISTLGASQITPGLRIPNAGIHPQALLYALILPLIVCVLLLSLQATQKQNRLPTFASAAAAISFSLVLVFSGIGCAAGVATGGNSTTSTISATATPTSQPSGGTFTAPQSVSITDSTANATICYTTDDSAPTSASSVYSGAFSLNSVTTVQAIASASGYNSSTIATEVFKFQTPVGSYPITINVTVTLAGSSKALQLSPIVLTLIVS